MKNKKWKIVHHTMENDDPRPIVTHIFYGDTRAEVMHVYEAHRKSDKFIRECDDVEMFDGKVRCHTVKYIEKKA